MSDLTITSLGHSGVLIRRGGKSLVVDPGIYSDLSVLHETPAILVTHEHTDHLDARAVLEALRANPKLEIWGPSSVVDLLAAAGGPSDRIHPMKSGDSATVNGFSVRALGGSHALVLPQIPIVANLAYLIDDSVLHPGDSFTDGPAGDHIQALLLPVSAPWMAVREAVGYLERVGPDVAIPIHDGFLNDSGKMLIDRVMGAVAGSVTYNRIEPGDTWGLAG